jgi:glycosyltransferase involved in cell wall biosynthesis
MTGTSHHQHTHAPIRIGIMLRAFDEQGGIGVYARNIVQELLNLDRHNQYVLFYANADNIGRFGGFDNVIERKVRAPGRALWDQVCIPLACRRDRIDVVFHPKFTAPLLAPCKAVMVVHGADWFIPEQARFYNRFDVMYIRAVMPYYVKKCSAVISVSQLTTDNFYRVLDLPKGKVQTVYFAPARHFKRVEDTNILGGVKRRYNLPDQFILTLTKRGGGGRKNLGQVIKAYQHYHRQAKNPYKLVIGGKDCHLFRDEYGIPPCDYGRDILFPGWIEQKDLPALYSMAGLYLYPSNLEAFPIPLTEAMACGTPIITSNVNGLEEIAGDAALRVDPSDETEISEAVLKVLSNNELGQKLSVRGLERSAMFTWDACARETLAILENVAS